MRSKIVAFALIAAAAIAALPAAADPARGKPSVPDYRRGKPSVPDHRRGEPSPDHRRGKPSAPVTLTAVAERVGAGWQVVIDAAPTRDVGSVELEVSGRRTRFGSTAAKRARHLVVPIDVAAGAGKDVVVVAHVGGRTKAILVRVGAPAPVAAKPAVTVRVVNGVTVAEVRQ